MSLNGVGPSGSVSKAEGPGVKSDVQKSNENLVGGGGQKHGGALAPTSLRPTAAEISAAKFGFDGGDASMSFEQALETLKGQFKTESESRDAVMKFINAYVRKLQDLNLSQKGGAKVVSSEGSSVREKALKAIGVSNFNAEVTVKVGGSGAVAAYEELFKTFGLIDTFHRSLPSGGFKEVSQAMVFAIEETLGSV